MNQLVLTRGTYRRSIFRKFMPNFEVGPYFLVVSLVLFVILITVITLMFSTRQVTKGYQLSELEAKNGELTKQSEVKDMEMSRVRSLQFIEGSRKVQRMVRPRGLVYLEIVDTAIAVK
ncbi:MAG: hypothetical protein WC873_04105 [Candidatus Gracilibacteria bacterium]